MQIHALFDLLPDDVRTHTLRVAARFDGDLRIVALLHDVVEDTFATLADIDAPHHIVRAVDAITRRPDEVYADYIARVDLDPLARAVKIADLEDHLEQAETLKPSLRPRYIRALEYLAPRALGE